MNAIRDQREAKNLSQDVVAEAAGLTYSVFVRIEEGSGKTTQDEVTHVLKVLKGMVPSTRKLGGRPFKDPEKQAAVKAARELGTSVAAALSGGEEVPNIVGLLKAEKPKRKHPSRAKAKVDA